MIIYFIKNTARKLLSFCVYPFYKIPVIILSREKKSTGSKNLLLVKLDEIGDYILFRNFIEQIRKSERFSDYRITLCGNVVWKSITDKYDSKYLDDLIWIDKKKYAFNILYRYKIFKKIINGNFETAINCSLSRSFYLDDEIIKISSARIKVCLS